MRFDEGVEPDSRGRLCCRHERRGKLAGDEVAGDDEWKIFFVASGLWPSVVDHRLDATFRLARTLAPPNLNPHSALCLGALVVKFTAVNRVRSEKLFVEALKYIPGGVNSPVRAFRAVGGNPFFVNRAKGAHVWDVDGNEFIDYVGTWGPAILGHAHPKIIAAVKAAADHGTSFGIPNPFEVKMAKLILNDGEHP